MYELLFRGQADKDYDLLPGIARGRHSPCQCTIFNDERNMIEMAKFKLPDLFRNDQSPLELLALLQHHGIPTRLLDVTENALVALYFACCSKPDTDGEVFVFKHEHRDVTNYPVVNAIADSYRFASRIALAGGVIMGIILGIQILKMSDEEYEAKKGTFTKGIPA